MLEEAKTKLVLYKRACKVGEVYAIHVTRELKKLGLKPGDYVKVTLERPDQ